MKTLIYILAPYQNGTHTLSRLLTEELGLEGGHEIMGQGAHGSMKELPWWICHQKCVKSGYGPEEESHGQPSDGRIADMYFEWVPYRYDGGDGEIWDDGVEYCGEWVARAFNNYLDGNGFFVDINCHLADFWYSFEYYAQRKNLQFRRVHLIRDGRMWAQRVVEQYKSFTGSGMHYGAVQNSETLYPYRDPKWRHEPAIIQAYRYWNALHTWFMTSGATTFRLEDLTNVETSSKLLNELYPEATVEQVKNFCDLLSKRYGMSEVQRVLEPYDEDAFEKICGDTMRKVGYKWT